MGRIATVHKNLAVLFPELLEEWDWDKNNELGIDPNQLLPFSDKETWWICKNKKHSYKTATKHRTSHNTGCPYCSNRKVCIDNCLATTHPHLIDEWDEDLNNVTPFDVIAGSQKYANWKCSRGHKWKARISTRTRKKPTKCPKCTEGTKTSFPEQAIYFYLKKVFVNIENKLIFNINNSNYEFDIFIPEISLAIEYDGRYHKKNKVIKRDELKNKFAFENNIDFIRVRCKGLPEIERYNTHVIIDDKCNNDSIQDVIISIFNYIISKESTKKEYIDKLTLTIKLIQVERDKFEIMKMYEQGIYEKSIVITHHNITKEWDYEKNGNLTPENFTYGSGFEAWWKCEFGHSWKYKISDRTRNNCNCPYCSGHRVSDKNRLSIIRPDIAKEWDYEKNIISPDDVSFGSNKEVWWKCEKEHSWNVSINSRTTFNTGCPYCCNQKLSIENSILYTHPELMTEWHPTKNNIKPNEITPGVQTINIWWICEKGHEYDAAPYNRTKLKSGCPYCSGRKSTMENCLATVNPVLAEEWNYEKNIDLTPFDVTPKSGKEVWWKCHTCSHEWIETPHKRSKRNTKIGKKKCPNCKYETCS